jgi:hypothetical protein
LVAEGQEATFTLEAVDGITRPQWYFFAWEGSVRLLRDCFGQLTCTVIPPKRGSVIVYGAWNGYAFGSEYLHIKTAPADSARGANLALTCTGDLGVNRVTRGGTISCNATKDPADAPDPLIVTGWSFDGVTRADGQSASTEWVGQMARSGTILVRGRIGSATERNASAAIEVVDREWAGRAPVFSIRRIQNGEDDRLTLSSQVRWAHDLGAADFFPVESEDDTPPEVSTVIQGGPNDGIAFFGDLSFRVFALYVLNDAAMTRGSDFYEAQEPSGAGGGTRIAGINWCDAGVVTRTLRSLVEAHELHHVEVYRETFTHELTSRLADLERRTGISGADLDDEYDAVWSDLDNIARDESRAIHKKRGNPNRVTLRDQGGECALKNELGGPLDNEEDANA